MKRSKILGDKYWSTDKIQKTVDIIIITLKVITKEMSSLTVTKITNEDFVICSIACSTFQSYDDKQILTYQRKGKERGEIS